MPDSTPSSRPDAGGQATALGPKWCDHREASLGRHFGPYCLCDHGGCFNYAVVFRSPHGTWFHYCAEHDPDAAASPDQEVPTDG